MPYLPQSLRSAGLRAVALFALSAPGLAPALSPAFDPLQTTPPTPAVIPESSTVTEIWRFVGTYYYDNNPDISVSGVLVHPYWVLATHHARGKVGTEYRSGYGVSSTFVWCDKKEEQPWMDAYDISLCMISPPIYPPAGVAFPKLLAQDAGPSLFGSGSTATGYLFGAGFGLPRRGFLSAAWATPTGQAAGYHPLTNPAAVRPQKGAGDSGSGLFWFARGKSEGVLAAINYGESDLAASGVLFNPTVKAWIQSYAGVLDWTTVSAYSAARTPISPVAAETVSTTANSATIKITKPVMQPGDTLNGYFLAAVVPPSTTLALLDSIQSQDFYVPYTFQNLQANTTYKFCALSYNEHGLMNFGGAGTQQPECSTFTPRNPPAAPTGLQAEVQTPPLPGYFAYRLKWTAPAAIPGASVTGYKLHLPGTPFDNLEIGNQTTFDITTATKPSFAVSALNQRTVGPVSAAIPLP